MNTSLPALPHLDDSEVVRHLDGEGSDVETRRWTAHLAGCGRCRDEVESLLADSALVSGWLAATDFEAGDGAEYGDTDAGAMGAAGAAGGAGAAGTVGAVGAGGTAGAGGRAGAAGAVAAGWMARRPRGAWGRTAPWLRAAAIVLLVAAPLAAIPPVREWIIERVERLRVEPAAEAPASTFRDARPNVIRFVPAAGAFTVTLEGERSGGTLRVGRASGPEAVLELQGVAEGQPWPETTLSPRDLRIGGGDRSEISYTLLLPAQIAEVTVIVAGRRSRVAPDGLDQPVVIPLGPAGARP